MRGFQLDRRTLRGYDLEKVDAVIDLVVSRYLEVESSGRMIDEVATKTMLTDVSGELLRRMIAGRTVNWVSWDVKDGHFTQVFDWSCKPGVVATFAGVRVASEGRPQKGFLSEVCGKAVIRRIGRK